MPAYFYHLAFELYRNNPLDYEHSISYGANAEFLPPRNFDVFSKFPAHYSSTWAAYIAPRKPHRRAKSSVGNFQSRSQQHLPFEGSSSDSFRRSITPTPQTLDKPLLGRGLGSTTRLAEPERAGAFRDWRFDRISMESIDMESLHDLVGSSTDDHKGVDSQERVYTNGLKGRYVPSNPRTTEIGSGVVHLYRDKKPSSLLSETSTSGSEPDVSPEVSQKDAHVDKDCTTLCILAVPTYMTPSDLLGWLGEPTRESVSHFRLVRTNRSNKYMVLMKFRDAESAKWWQKEWNGKAFNSLEPENCHVVFVKSIRFDAQDSNNDHSSFPHVKNDPFTPDPRSSMVQPVLSNTADQTSRSPATLTSKPAPPPTPALYELPTCPVCLERMDETTGLATIFCQHVFHCACLQKWRGSGCPVCRYTQNEPAIRGKRNDEAESECNVCGSTVNLWICLICGHVGCGRYDDAHAFAHYEQTSHSFAMDVDTQHIWDYTGDEYVHRLIQNKSDGKLVELPSAITDDSEVPTDGMIPREKMENMSLEYTYLLTSQLDSQRAYFEEQVDRAVDKASKASAAAEHAALVATKATEQLNTLQAAHDSLAKETVPSLQRGKERAEKRAEKFETMARSMEKEYKEKEVINESLMDRIGHIEKQLNEASMKNSDLEEQNRDLSFFISGMEKLKNQGEDIQEGTLSVPDPPTTSTKKKKGKGKA